MQGLMLKYIDLLFCCVISQAFPDTGKLYSKKYTPAIFLIIRLPLIEGQNAILHNGISFHPTGKTVLAKTLAK